VRLLAFTRAGSLPLGQIGSRLQVHPASVTSAIDRLERQGFVRRVPHPTDGRAVLAEITAAGRQVVERATVDLNERAFTQMPVPDSDVAELVRILREIRRAAGDFAEAEADQPA
jgi:DNA-binding MarR family transcriptional regulator